MAIKTLPKIALLCSLGLFGFDTNSARASELGTGIYLLGSTSSLAGVVPPPGVYVVDYKYFFHGTAEGAAAAAFSSRRGVGLSLNLDVKVEATAYAEIPTLLWVSKQKILGGNLALGVAVPVGRLDVDVGVTARAALTLPPPIGTTLPSGGRLNLEDGLTAFGDPQPVAMIGWHAGNWHWKVGANLNVPIGPWEQGRLANLALGYWAIDVNAGLTWLDPKIGFEISVAPGVTYNWENQESHYKSGTSLHLEAALMQHLSKGLAVGVAGYHYQQVTGDSGAGAQLGSFEGRVTALGPAVDLNFQIGQIPVSASLRWFKEFNVENRLQAETGFLTLSMPLSAPPPPAAPLK